MKVGPATKEVAPLSVERESQVATIRFRSATTLAPDEYLGAVYGRLGATLEDLRWDNDIRVVIITGETDGDFLSLRSPDFYEEAKSGFGEILRDWHVGQGPMRAHHALALIEKPVIARVNGDAFSFAQTIALGCDMIVALESALMGDAHLGLGETKGSNGSRVGTQFGAVPGDGAMALVPLFLPPTKAKEYLMLAKPYTASELAEMNIVNYAVPADEIDDVVNSLVEQLLARPAKALAYTKRVANKRLVNQLNLALDSSEAYEKLSLYEHILGGFDNAVGFE